MKLSKVILLALCCAVPTRGAVAAASKCSKNNLTRCMDSACAINSGINPSARCQYCGTANAGTPPAQKGLANVTAGQSMKYALSAKDLSNAPSDPEKRYNWAATECIKKLPDCTRDDITAAYDKLIEQSCKSAGVTIQLAKSTANLNAKPTKNKCNTTFTTCMDKKCGAAFDSCPTDADLSRAIAECATDASGCDEYIPEFRETFTAARANATDNREEVLQSIIKNHQDSRTGDLDTARQKCKSGTAAESCIATVCAKNMRGKCKGDDAATETAMAKQLCKFYETACTVLK